MRLHYDSKLRRSLDKAGALAGKDKFGLKELGRRSHARKQSDSGGRGADPENRFLHLKNEHRSSFGHLYQNYFGHKPRGAGRRVDSTAREAKEKTLELKRRSLADLKAHFRLGKNDGGSSVAKARAKFESLQRSLTRGLYGAGGPGGRLARAQGDLPREARVAAREGEQEGAIAFQFERDHHAGRERALRVQAGAEGAAEAAAGEQVLELQLLGAEEEPGRQAEGALLVAEPAALARGRAPLAKVA